YDLPNKDFTELKTDGKLTIISTPYSNGIQYIGMNVQRPPFDNVKVRHAMAYAMPYQKIMDAVLYGLAKPMFGAPADAATEVAWPQPHKFNTDLDKAKQLLAVAGVSGLDEPISFDLGFAGVNEPICVLVQESLAQIGIMTTINKVPGANWRTELTKKTMPLFTNVFSGWLDYPEYFFTWCYHGGKSIFNTMDYQSPAMDALIDSARAAAAVGDNAEDSTMLTMILKRAAMAIPSLIGVVIVTFLLTRALPGDPAAYFAGPAATPQAIQEVRVKLGLDKPLTVQFGRYVDDLAHGNLGTSLTTGQPVVTELRTRLPASAELTLLGLLVSIVIAVPLGILAATRPNSLIDHACRLVTTL